MSVYDQLLKTFLEWPPIFQSAMGSALFWFILVISKKLVDFVPKRLLVFSNKYRLSYLQSEHLRYNGIALDDKSTASYCFILLIYGAIYNIIKAFLFVCVGIFLSYLISPVFIYVTLIFVTYYLIKAFYKVKSIKPQSDIEQIIKEIKTEMEEIKKKINN